MALEVHPCNMSSGLQRALCAPRPPMLEPKRGEQGQLGGGLQNALLMQPELLVRARSLVLDKEGRNTFHPVQM